MLTSPVLTTANHKGGVGKTFLACNLSHYLLPHFRRILVIDFDSSGDITRILSEGRVKKGPGIEDVLRFAITEYEKLDESVARTKILEILRSKKVTVLQEGNRLIDLLPSSDDLHRNVAALTIQYHQSAFWSMKDVLRMIAKEYDLTIIDTPPSADFMIGPAFISADFVIFPLTGDVDSVNGYMQVKDNYFKLATRRYNKDLRILGIVMNKLDNSRISRAGESFARERLQEHIFSAVISRSTRVRELTNYNSTLDVLAPSSKSAAQMKALAKEVYERMLANGVAPAKGRR
jgi:chromosome partitioning protein